MHVTILLPEHTPANDTRDDAPDCAPEHEVAMGFEPDDPHYGADRDGNRGEFRRGAIFVDDELPTTCRVCGYRFDDIDQLEMIARAEKRAARDKADAAESAAIDAYEQRTSHRT